MKRYATILDADIHYPNQCPFTGKPNPEGEIVVQKTTERVIPIPFVCLWRRVWRTELRVPADRRFCRQVRMLDILMAVFLFLGPCVAAPLIVIRMMSDSVKPMTDLALLFFASIAVAIACAIVRFRLVRNFRIVDHFDGRVKLCFRSEDYANDFARLNRCGLD